MTKKKLAPSVSEKKSADGSDEETQTLSERMEPYYRYSRDVPLVHIFPWCKAREARNRDGLSALMTSFRTRGFIRGVGTISVLIVATEEQKVWTEAEKKELAELVGVPVEKLQRLYGTIDGRSRWSTLWYAILDKVKPKYFHVDMCVPVIAYEGLPPQLALVFAQTANLCNEIFVGTKMADLINFVRLLQETLRKANLKCDKTSVLAELGRHGSTLGNEGVGTTKLKAKKHENLYKLSVNVHPDALMEMSRLYDIDAVGVLALVGEMAGIAVDDTTSTTFISVHKHDFLSLREIVNVFSVGQSVAYQSAIARRAWFIWLRHMGESVVKADTYREWGDDQTWAEDQQDDILHIRAVIAVSTLEHSGDQDSLALLTSIHFLLHDPSNDEVVDRLMAEFWEARQGLVSWGPLRGTFLPRKDKEIRKKQGKENQEKEKEEKEKERKEKEDQKEKERKEKEKEEKKKEKERKEKERKEKEKERKEKEKEKKEKEKKAREEKKEKDKEEGSSSSSDDEDSSDDVSSTSEDEDTSLAVVKANAKPKSVVPTGGPTGGYEVVTSSRAVVPTGEAEEKERQELELELGVTGCELRLRDQSLVQEISDIVDAIPASAWEPMQPVERNGRRVTLDTRLPEKTMGRLIGGLAYMVSDYAGEPYGVMRCDPLTKTPPHVLEFGLNQYPHIEGVMHEDIFSVIYHPNRGYATYQGSRMDVSKLLLKTKGDHDALTVLATKITKILGYAKSDMDRRKGRWGWKRPGECTVFRGRYQIHAGLAAARNTPSRHTMFFSFYPLRLKDAWKDPRNTSEFPIGLLGEVTFEDLLEQYERLTNTGKRQRVPLHCTGITLQPTR